MKPKEMYARATIARSALKRANETLDVRTRDFLAGPIGEVMTFLDEVLQANKHHNEEDTEVAAAEPAASKEHGKDVGHGRKPKA